MKRICIALVLSVVLSQCTTLKKEQNPVKPVKPEADREIVNSWALYSKGLYYKSIDEYRKAIDYLQEAAAFKENLSLVYYQLSECYFYTLDYENAVNYSKLSIKEDKTNNKPYILLYKIYLNLGEYSEAASALESLLYIKPELINIHYTLGILYYNQIKDYNRSREAFNNIINPGSGITVEDYYKEQAHYYLGRIYYNTNQVERSIKHFYKVIDINPENNVAHYLLIRILMDRFEIEEAKGLCQYYIMKFPPNVFVYTALGRIYYIEDNPGAMEYLREAKYSKSAHGNLAKALHDELLKKDRIAEPNLKNIIKQDPLLIAPHIASGRISLRNGNRKEAVSEFFTAGILLYKARLYYEARSAFIKVLSINDKIPEVFLYLGKIYEETGNLSLAVLNLKKSCELKPGAEIIVHIGYIYSRQNNFEESTKYFDMAIEDEPENPKPYFFKGLLYTREENFKQAELFIRKAIELREDNDTYHFYLATVLEKQHRIEETIESLKNAIKYNPENAMAYNYLGYLYADLNINLDESITLIQKALEFSPSNGAYLDSLGWAYYRKGKFALALERLLEAEKQLEEDNTPDPVVFDHIGDTYHKIGNGEKALEYWQKSINLQKNEKIEKKIKEYNVQK